MERYPNVNPNPVRKQDSTLHTPHFLTRSWCNTYHHDELERIQDHILFWHQNTSDVDTISSSKT